MVAQSADERPSPGRYGDGMTLTIAERRLDLRDCARWLVNDYNPLTVEYYDHGEDSARTGVTVADIGRMTVFAARLNYKQADGFLERGRETAPWPPDDMELRLDARPDLTPAEFSDTAEFEAARKIFTHVKGSGWPRAQTSKLLHLKWPKFFPVVDRECRNVYWRQADDIRETHFRDLDRRSVEGYWLAIRADLIANESGLVRLRDAVADLRSAGDSDHVDRLTQLSSLRLLDMLTWGVGRGELPTA